MTLKSLTPVKIKVLSTSEVILITKGHLRLEIIFINMKCLNY